MSDFWDILLPAAGVVATGLTAGAAAPAAAAATGALEAGALGTGTALSGTAGLLGAEGAAAGLAGQATMGQALASGVMPEVAGAATGAGAAAAPTMAPGVQTAQAAMAANQGIAAPMPGYAEMLYGGGSPVGLPPPQAPNAAGLPPLPEPVTLPQQAPIPELTAGADPLAAPGAKVPANAAKSQALTPQQMQSLGNLMNNGDQRQPAAVAPAPPAGRPIGQMAQVSAPTYSSAPRAGLGSIIYGRR